MIGRPMGRFYWQNVGESVPCQVPGHSRPTTLGVSAEERTRRSREVTKGLQEIARRKAVEVARSTRKVARKRAGRRVQGAAALSGWRPSWGVAASTAELYFRL